MPPVDLRPAAQLLAELVRAVPDDRLSSPTPCPDYTVGDLLAHVGGLAMAFTAAARKDFGDSTTMAPAGDAAQLAPDWRTRIPDALAALGQAWREPAAWTGMTQAGGVDLPGEIAGLVALDEIVVHGWDVARATRQAYHPDQPSLKAVHEFLLGFDAPRSQDAGAIFGPVVAVADSEPLIDRVIGLSGRHPAW
jgi:uncharacterized protein (TIGR03086 family)